MPPKTRTTKTPKAKVQAKNNSVAVESISIAGSIAGSMVIGSNNVVGFTSEQVSVLIEQISTTFRPKKFDGRCPYKGLDVFDEDDAGLFFGREKLVEGLVSRVKVSRTVFVTGPSGSGKSSLVRAGLIHALKQGDIRESHSERWLYATLKPGRDPFDALKNAFSRLKSPELGNYFLQNISKANVLHECAESALNERKDHRLVLFIDQFEEIFTQISKEDERVRFLDLLTYAATVENGRVILLFAMRSDFVSNCATYPKLNALLNQQFVQIGAMQPDELVSAIAQPALRVGLKIDPDLISQIINDMEGEPGSLPLMQFALKDLFEIQQEKGGVIALTRAGYIERGGIRKSLERHADKTFAEFSENEQDLARSIFTGLIEIGRGVQDTRRTAMFDELVPASVKSPEIETIVRKLADARLITTDEIGGKDTVTISHEKLIDAWPWLKKLVNENRDVIALQNEIAEDAHEWESHKRDASYLYSGGRLLSTWEKLRGKKITLSGLSQQFLQAAQARRQRARITTVAMISVVITSLVIAVLIFQSQAGENLRLANVAATQANIAAENAKIAGENEERARKAQLEAEQQAHLARVGELAAQTLALQEDHPVFSLLMGVEAFRLQDNLRTRTVLVDNLNFNPQVVQFFSDQPYILEGVAFSPDGKIIASSGFNEAVTLWSLETGQQIGVLQSEHPNPVRSIAFSPDGQTLAAGDDGNEIVLWDMKSRQPIGAPITGHSDTLRSIAFSPDGTTLASGSADRTIRLWDVPTRQAIGEPLTGHSDIVYSVAFSPDGKTLVSGSVDQTVRLWNVETRQQIGQPLVGHTGWVKSVAFHPNGNMVASGSTDETIILWDVAGQKMIGTPLAEHAGEVRSVMFSPDGKTLVSGSSDKTIIRWDVETRRPIGEPFTGHTERVVGIAFSPDGSKLASVGDDGLTILWHAEPNLALGQHLEGHTQSVNSLAYSPDGKVLASASNDHSIILWDEQTGQPIGDPITIYDERVTSIAFRPNSSTVASGFADGMILLWDTGSRSPIGAPLLGHSDAITSLAYNQDGTMLASGSLDNTIILWDPNTYQPIGKPLVKHSAPVRSLAFSSKGDILASGSANQSIVLWDVKSSEPSGKLLGGKTTSGFSIAFSPDGRLVASGTSDNTVLIWDTQTFQPDGTPLLGHKDAITGVAFNWDGTMLASGSSDNTIIFWNFPSRQPLGEPIQVDLGTITSLMFNPTKNRLASGTVDGSIILWDLDPASWLQKTCQRAGRNFSKSEWTLYFPNVEYHTTCPQWPTGD